jgi:hypothetical protein
MEGLIPVILIVLKLAGEISWPWVAVLAPLWVPFALTFGIGVLTMLLVRLWNYINRGGR